MWQDLVAWFQSPGGARVLQTAIIPALAILVAGVLAAVIARAALQAAIRRSDRFEASSAVGALVAAAHGVTENHGDDDSRRWASRLRGEADVRLRLLPLPNAGTAADWAAAHIDAAAGRAPEDDVTNDVDALRDRLVDWVNRPGRAKRIFAAAPRQPALAASEPVATAPEPPPAAPERPQPLPGRAVPERFARPAAGPRRSPASAGQPTTTAVDESEEAAGVAVPAAAASAAVSSASPAWQRTRAGERLQQERGRTRAVEPPIVDEPEELPIPTAPVQIAQAHRAPAVPSVDADEAVRLEAHQQAKHARPTDAAPSATGAAPAAPVTAAPAWLDTYDDEAQVTQNLDLKTPPPVAAAAIRGRGAPGEDLVPRS